MKRKITIEYIWNNQNEEWENVPVQPEHEEELQEAAELHISKMMERGYTSGVLQHVCDNDDPSNAEIEYRGGWTVSKES